MRNIEVISIALRGLLLYSGMLILCSQLDAQTLNQGDVICSEYSSIDDTCSDISTILGIGSDGMSLRSKSALVYPDSTDLAWTSLNKYQSIDGKMCWIEASLVDVSSDMETDAELFRIWFEEMNKTKHLLETCHQIIECGRGQFFMTFLKGEYSSQNSGRVQIFRRGNLIIERLALRPLTIEDIVARQYAPSRPLPDDCLPNG